MHQEKTAALTGNGTNAHKKRDAVQFVERTSKKFIWAIQAVRKLS